MPRKRLYVRDVYNWVGELSAEVRGQLWYARILTAAVVILFVFATLDVYYDRKQEIAIAEALEVRERHSEIAFTRLREIDVRVREIEHRLDDLAHAEARIDHMTDRITASGAAVMHAIGSLESRLAAGEVNARLQAELEGE